MERLDHIEPLIPLGKRFWPLSSEERDAITELLSSDAVLDLVGALHGRGRQFGATLVDAAYWMKGCSSLGTLRYACSCGSAGARTRLITA